MRDHEYFPTPTANDCGHVPAGVLCSDLIVIDTRSLRSFVDILQRGIVVLLLDLFRSSCDRNALRSSLLYYFLFLVALAVAQYSHYFLLIFSVFI